MEDGNNRRDQRPQSVVRSGDWKLLYNYEDQTYELYNLSTDISESTNVAEDYLNVTSELATSLMNWLHETDAPLATLRSGSISLGFNGAYYQEGQVLQNRGLLTIEAGDEVPLILGDLMNLADLNLDSKVNAADWLLFRGGRGANFNNLTREQAFRLGDLDGDFDNDLADFLAFKSAWETRNGKGSLAAIVSVPEPSTIAILSVGLFVSIRDLRRRGRMGSSRLLLRALVAQARNLVLTAAPVVVVKGH